MGHHSEAFVGIDTAKLRNAISVAEAGRNGEVHYLGEVDTSETATRKLVAGLSARYRKLTFCYEAGPTGYGLQRLIESLRRNNAQARGMELRAAWPDEEAPGAGRRHGRGGLASPRLCVPDAAGTMAG